MHDTTARDSRRILPELALYSLVAGALLVIASVANGKPFWSLKSPVIAMLLLVVAATISWRWASSSLNGAAA